MAKVGVGSGQGRIRKLTNGVFVRCTGTKEIRDDSGKLLETLHCIERCEIVYPKGERHLAAEYKYRCGKNACPVRPKNETRVGQQKQARSKK